VSALAHSRTIQPTPGWPALLAELERLERVVVAFSGGVDSTLLAKAAHDVLGARALAVTAVSPSLAVAEREDARRLAELVGIACREVVTHEGQDPRYAANAVDRCYFCKKHLFDTLAPLLAERGGGTLVYGATVDDLGEHRPGMDAAREAGVAAPFLVAGLGKAEIREASRRLGLPTWDKPALACLASRLPHGTTVTPERLAQVDRAEAALRALGYRQLRVRHLGDRARIEVAPEELPRALAEAPRLVAAVVDAGFAEAFVDPEGYRAGRLVEGLAPAGRSAPRP